MTDTSSKSETRVVIYTDGACKGNPGPGGWGVYLKHGEVEKDLFGGELQTTNNRMELLGPIMALESLAGPTTVRLTSDSPYVIKGMTEWLKGWKRKNWKDVKNPGLWQRLDRVAQIHRVSWVWVRGHNGHAENERCDVLANEAIRQGRAGVLASSNAAPVAAQTTLAL